MKLFILYQTDNWKSRASRVWPARGGNAEKIRRSQSNGTQRRGLDPLGERASPECHRPKAAQAK